MNRTVRRLFAFCISMIVMNVSASKFEKDWHSYSNYQDIVTTHVHLNLTVDFDTKQLKGSIEHQLNYLNNATKSLVLDTRDLDIHKVEAFDGL